jgi:N-acetylneuraminic acid mutarotase
MLWCVGSRPVQIQYLVVFSTILLGVGCGSSEPTSNNPAVPRLVSLVIVTDSAELLVGDTLVVYAEFVDDKGQRLRASRPSWSCTNPSVALVTPAGELQALAEGRAVLKAAAGGFEDEAPVVVGPDLIVGFQVTPDTTRLPVGEVATLVAEYVRLSGRTLEAESVSWESESGSVVGIDANGRVTAISPGRGVIRAAADTVTAEAVVYVPGWFQLPRLPEPRRAGHAAAVDGRVFYIGGNFSGSRDYRATTYVFDIASQTWSEGPPMPTARDHGATAVVEDRIHIIGGNCELTVHEVLHTSDMTWTTAAPSPDRLCAQRADTLNGLVYTLGGSRAGSNDTVLVYNPADDSWALKDRIRYRRNVFALGSIDGNFYLAGLSTASWSGSSLLVYDPAREKLHDRPEMLTPRYYVAGVVWRGQLFAIGGTGARDVVKDAVESYDPSRNEWSVHPPLPLPLREVRAVAVGGVIYVLGGAYNDYGSHTEPTDYVFGYVP